MHRFLLSSLLALLVATSVAQAEPAGHADPKLLRLASRLSALRVRRPVPIVVVSPARLRLHRLGQQDLLTPPETRAYERMLYGALGLPGAPAALRNALAAAGGALYEPAVGKVFAQRGSVSRQTLLPALVHALQDQHFGRVADLAGDRDRRLAGGAALEGHALLAAGNAGTNTAASLGNTPLSRFVEFERSFPGTIGLRFALTLRNLGGNAALVEALRRFPSTTEQIFHLDKFLEREPAAPIVLPRQAAGLTLARSGTFGELDVRALLAAFSIPDRDRVGEGWGGGRSAVYRDAAGGHAVALVLEWDSERDAAEWAGAVPRYVAAAFGRASATPCAAACWDVDGRTLAAAASGTRTVVAVAATSPGATELARTLAGLLLSFNLD